MKIVKITWDDAEDPCGGDTWMHFRDVKAFAQKRCTVVSVGHLVCKTPHYTAIAGDCVDGYFGRVTKIPNRMIESIEEV